jgi:hypothetical protein
VPKQKKSHGWLNHGSVSEVRTARMNSASVIWIGSIDHGLLGDRNDKAPYAFSVTMPMSAGINTCRLFFPAKGAVRFVDI